VHVNKQKKRRNEPAVPFLSLCTLCACTNVSQ
jgi:hypothetical protein